MKFMDWVKQQLNIFVSPRSRHQSNRRGRRRDYHQRKRWQSGEADLKNHTQMTEENAHFNQDKVEEQPNGLVNDLSPAPDQVDESSQLQSQVTFFYLDENDDPIKTPDILIGHDGERFSLQLPSFKQYYLVSIDNFSAYFADTDQEVTLRYALKQGLPVLTYYLDIDTGETLHHVTIHSGKLGESYNVSAVDIPGYRVINDIGRTHGDFDDRTHGIIFYYRRTEWRTVQQVEYYVRLKKRHEVLDEPNGQAPQTGLPANVITKIFARIDTTDNQSWLNIGGFEWIKNVDLEPSDPPTNHLVPPITKTSRNPVMLFGTVDFVAGRPIEVLDKPYGTSAGTLEDGQRVSIKARIIDDQGLIWYELADQSVIFSEYVRIDS